MSELRLDPTTREWVIIAGERSRRPHEYARPKKRDEVPPYVDSCPFCPGNESMTPPAILEISDPETRAWRIRGFPNKFAALGDGYPLLSNADGPLFIAEPGEGAHEVLVETTGHNRLPATRTEEEMLLLVQAYHERYLAMIERPSTRYVLIFKNHGEDAGTSLEHPHSQIIAAPVVPETVRRKCEISGEHYERMGQCLYCRLAEEEIRSEGRVVYCDQQFVAYHPFAAAHTAETWIVPLAHQSSFAQLGRDGLVCFASVLTRTLRQLSTGFSDPDFNYAIHSAPRGDEEKPYSHWYLQIIPHLSKTAGFELGSGIYINTAPPEHTAEIMRRAPI